MYSNNPRNDLFDITIGEDFFIPYICEKYNKILKSIKYPIDDIISCVHESIQLFDNSDYTTNLVKQSVQTDDGGTTETSPPTNTSVQNLMEKIISVTFRHTDGFMNYNFLLEHYYARGKIGEVNENRKPFSSIVTTTKSATNLFYIDSFYRDCQIAEFPKLVLSKANFDRQHDNFRILFAFNTFDTNITVPNLILK